MKKNSLKQTSLLSNLKSWFYKIFHKRENVEKSIMNSENDKNETQEKTLFERYKESNERRLYLLDLQRKYKDKKILEKDMSDEDRNDLEKLYEDQNADLKRKIRNLDSKIVKSKE